MDLDDEQILRHSIKEVLASLYIMHQEIKKLDFPEAVIDHILITMFNMQYDSYRRETDPLHMMLTQMFSSIPTTKSLQEEEEDEE
jgi:hypothetical protein